MVLRKVLMAAALLSLTVWGAHVSASGYRVYDVRLTQKTNDAYLWLERCVALDPVNVNIDWVLEVNEERTRTSRAVQDHIAGLREKALNGSESSRKLHNDWVEEHEPVLVHLDGECVAILKRIAEIYGG